MDKVRYRYGQSEIDTRGITIILIGSLCMHTGMIRIT